MVPWVHSLFGFHCSQIVGHPEGSSLRGQSAWMKQLHPSTGQTNTVVCIGTTKDKPQIPLFWTRRHCQNFLDENLCFLPPFHSGVESNLDPMNWRKLVSHDEHSWSLSGHLTVLHTFFECTLLDRFSVHDFLSIFCWYTHFTFSLLYREGCLTALFPRKKITGPHTAYSSRIWWSHSEFGAFRNLSCCQEPDTSWWTLWWQVMTWNVGAENVFQCLLLSLSLCYRTAIWERMGCWTCISFHTRTTTLAGWKQLTSISMEVKSSCIWDRKLFVFLSVVIAAKMFVSDNM